VTVPRPVGQVPLAPNAPGAAIPDASAIYLRTLIRAQLRLAVTLAIGFAVTITLAAVVIAAVPILHEADVWGVPWSWLLQAYGMYPIVAACAVVYVRSATRNERRYRSLESRR
jgi:putative solute:sodium symporter small subunit